MQLLTDRQLREVTRLINDYHSAFVVNIGLGDIIPDDDVKRLKKMGLIDLMPKSLAEDAFMFGFLADALSESKAKKMSYDGFKQWLKFQKPALSHEEMAAVKHIRRSLATHVRGIGGKMDKGTHEVLVEADQDLRRRLAATVKRELIRGIEKRKSIAEIVNKLRKSTKESARDWQRVVATELNNAFQEGKLTTIMKANKGRDPRVFKRVKKSACAECKSAYLTKSGKPRVFKLSELLANGSNVGRSSDDRRASVESHHPWCQCELQEMPSGFEFNDKGTMVFRATRFGT